MNLGAEFTRLVTIQELWMRAATALTHTPETELLGVWFLNQANSSWMAAIRTGLGGQVVEAQALFRSALEYAAYALHFTVNPNLQELWFKRHDGDDARRAVRDAFSVRKVKDTLRQASTSLANRFEALYEQAIDFGAHPNERALTSRLNVRSEAGFTISSVTQLTDKKDDYFFLTKTASRVGALALGIFDRVFATKFRLTSLDVDIEALLKSV